MSLKSWKIEKDVNLDSRLQIQKVSCLLEW